MTASREISSFNIPAGTKETDFDPIGLSPEQMGHYLVERGLATESQKVDLARVALMRGNLLQAEYASVVAKLNQVEQQAIQSGVDPSQFDGEAISRGFHF